MKGSISVVVALIASYTLYNLIENLITGKLMNLVVLGVSGVCCVCVYVFMLFMLKTEEVYSLIKVLLKKEGKNE